MWKAGSLCTEQGEVLTAKRLAKRGQTATWVLIGLACQFWLDSQPVPRALQQQNKELALRYKRRWVAVCDDAPPTCTASIVQADLWGPCLPVSAYGGCRLRYI